MQWFHLVMLAVAAIAAVTDYRTGLIPNRLTFPVIAATPLVFLPFSLEAASHSVAAIAVCGLVPYCMYRLRTLGGGDVKLFAALGGLGGVTMGLELMMLSLMVAMGLALVLMACRGQLQAVLLNVWRILQNMVLPRTRRIPVAQTQLHSLRLAPSIFVATILVIGYPYG